MNDLFESLKIALFPKRCKFCGEIIEFDKDVCESCEKSLPRIETPLCLKCGCSKKDCICDKTKHHVMQYKSVIAPFYYDGNIKKGIYNFKMNAMPKLANYYGVEIANKVKEYYALIDFDYVTFIPMRKSDLIKREFNQAELLAKVVSKECNIPLKKLIVKNRKTKKQKTQSAKQRFSNMYDAFSINKNVNVDNTKILLIDDVKTTGATLSSAANILKAYGAKEVYCATFAITTQKHYKNK